MNTKRMQRTLAVLGLLTLTALAPWGRATLPAHAQTAARTFPETGQTVQGRFLDYWQAHGGLAQQGYPISREMQETSDTDGKPYTVQYFERAVFEHHPENQPPNDVLLSLLGTFLYKQRYPNGAPGQISNNEPGSQLFAATGHRLGGIFLTYWQAHGGLAQQGYPISDEFQEVSAVDGKTYRVQYFERAVFEYHPENQPPYNVLLSLLGRLRYDAKYNVTPTPALASPTPVAAPTTTSAPVGSVAATISLPVSGPQALTYGFGSLWVAAYSGRALLRVDPESGTVLHTFTFGGPCAAVLVTNDSVWATAAQDTHDPSPTMLVKIDPATDAVAGTYKVADSAVGGNMAWANGSIWLVVDAEGVLKRIDRGTGNIIASIPVENPSRDAASSAISANGDVWTTSGPDQNLVHVDPRTNQVVEKFPLGVPADEVVQLGNSLWIASFSYGTLLQFDLQTKTVGAQLNTGRISGLLATNNAIWFSATDRGYIARVDPTTNVELGKVRVTTRSGQYPQQIVYVAGALWVAVGGGQNGNELVKVIPSP